MNLYDWREIDDVRTPHKDLRWRLCQKFFDGEMITVGCFACGVLVHRYISGCEAALEGVDNVWWLIQDQIHFGIKQLDCFLSEDETTCIAPMVVKKDSEE